MKRKTQGKTGYSALKIDMSKAYDRLEWKFVLEIMKKLGFPQKWIDWIFLSMSTMKYTFIVSSHEVGPVWPKRGPLQGDPISLYMFLLCAEGLTSLI